MTIAAVRGRTVVTRWEKNIDLSARRVQSFYGSEIFFTEFGVESRIRFSRTIPRDQIKKEKPIDAVLIPKNRNIFGQFITDPVMRFWPFRFRVPWAKKHRHSPTAVKIVLKKFDPFYRRIPIGGCTA